MTKTMRFVFVMMFVFGFIVVAPAIAKADPPPSTPDCAEQVWAQVQYYEPMVNDLMEIVQSKEQQIEDAWAYHWEAEEEWQETVAVLKDKNRYLRDRRDYWKDRYLDLRDK